MKRSKVDPARYPSYYEEVTLTNDEIKALNTAPQEIISTPGKGLTIRLDSAIATLTAGTAYATTTTFSLNFTNAAGKVIAAAGPAILAETGKVSAYIGASGFSATSELEENVPVVVAAAANPIGGSAARTLKVRVWYTLIPVA